MPKPDESRDGMEVSTPRQETTESASRSFDGVDSNDHDERSESPEQAALDIYIGIRK